MLIIHHNKDNSPESSAAEHLGRLACDSCPEIADSKQIVLELFPNVQCFGQNPQDIDVLVFYSDYRPIGNTFKTSSGRSVHSFCATVEVKGHSPEHVIFEGPKCAVFYHEEKHDVTAQSEKQKYSVKKYIERNSGTPRAPRIINLIWLRRVNNKSIPKIDTNILGMDITWEHFLESAGMLARADEDAVVKTFSSRSWMSRITSIFSKRLEVSKTDRSRLEAITKRVLDRTKQQFAEKLGKQLLIFRGRGGTGKTVRLIQIAYQAYDEQRLPVLLLTYNKALVADLRRLLVLLGVKEAIGEGSIAIKTIHQFMYEWLSSLAVINKGEPDFISNYEEHKQEALSLLKAEAITSKDIVKARAAASRDLAWDLILIDEAQDWPVTERDLIYHLYGHTKIILADGVDQFVRGVDRIDWREGLNKPETQVITLTKSLRLKASLCQTVAHFAEQIEFGNWNLEPLPDVQGGKVVVVVGNALSNEFHGRLAATAKADGNRPIDMLLCVPPTWVEKIEGQKQSIVAKAFKSWGWDVWDAVDPEIRDDFPNKP